MKYIVKYKLGNGYTCHCCSSWSPEEIECSSYEEALKNVSDILLYERGDGDYDTTIAIAESPDDFIKNEYGEFELNFNLDKFEEEAQKQSKLVKVERENQEKILEEQERIKAQKFKEAQEKREYERLKAKFEKA